MQSSDRSSHSTANNNPVNGYIFIGIGSLLIVLGVVLINSVALEILPSLAFVEGFEFIISVVGGALIFSGLFLLLFRKKITYRLFALILLVAGIVLNEWLLAAIFKLDKIPGYLIMTRLFNLTMLFFGALFLLLSYKALLRERLDKSDLFGFLHIATLSTFALAQPIFDLLGRHAEFFIARHSEASDIILFTLLLILSLPLLLIGLELFAVLIRRKLAEYLHISFMAFLLLLIAMQIVKALPLRGGLILLLSLILAGGLTFGYKKLQALKSVVTFISPGIIIFPLIFLFFTPVKRIIFSDNSSTGQIVRHKSPAESRTNTPIIMLVMDELPLSVLLSGRYEINHKLFPNYSLLSKTFTWYPNVLTVSGSTTKAVPAIITGNYPKKNTLPSFTDMPNNLFTILPDHYKYNVIESATRLCPKQLCGDSSDKYKEFQYPAERMFMTLQESISALTFLFSDIYIVYSYLVLPSDFTKNLPAINRGWNNFQNKKVKRRKKGFFRGGLERHILKNIHIPRDKLFNDFVKSIDASKDNYLHFFHFLFPHIPLEYLSSGKKYRPAKINNLINDRWTSDKLLLKQAYSRFVHQVIYSDKLIGDLIKRLKSVNLYDKAIIIITADHGVSFRINSRRRKLSQETYHDILSIPLFIKMPFQKKGMIVKNNIMSIDILPTLAEALKIKLSWTPDGQSFLNPAKHKTQNTKLIADLKKNDIHFSYKELNQNLRKSYRNITNESELYKLTPHSTFLGRSPDGINAKLKRIAVRLDQSNQLDNLNLKDDYLPCHLTGDFENSEQSKGRYLFISVNKVISAVTLPVRKRDKSIFSVMIPQKALRDGKNDLEFYLY
ncbi:MAG: sulfatase-like hydrolase/transferase [Spirochaetota bacterium]|nr:sulfatase-like hydrolase/transferase [Spirochaetota bacterium]